MMPLEIDTSAITGAITQVGTAGGVIIAAAIAVAIGFFGLPFLWRLAKKVISS